MIATPMVKLRDVTLRDGLQDESPISIQQKVTLLSALVRSGITDLELTSFTRADRVPAMADADIFAAEALNTFPNAVLWGLVLNRRGAERALRAGIRNVQFVVSVSNAHNQENAGRTTADSLKELGVVSELARENGVKLEVTLATAFGCPYMGPITPDAVLSLVDEALAAGIDGLSLADTIGTAMPNEVKSLVRRVVETASPVPIGIHLHDTRGLAIANALAAIDANVARIDGSLGGLGGCPFAPGASGNLVLEDLVHALDGMGLQTGVAMDALLEASVSACQLVGRRPTGHVVIAGPRFMNQAPRLVPDEVEEHEFPES